MQEDLLQLLVPIVLARAILLLARCLLQLLVWGLHLYRHFWFACNIFETNDVIHKLLRRTSHHMFRAYPGAVGMRGFGTVPLWARLYCLFRAEAACR